jgi:hypothetical protein
MNSQPTVAVFIDADNVSATVIEAALERVQTRFAAAHLRRAYGSAELMQAHKELFTRLGIRPMVNLSAGKNSTDIAMAADAAALAAAGRMQVAVVVSSDSDFSPLVVLLREWGCAVHGYGQAGKTGEQVAALYDSFEDLPHRAPRTAGAPPAAASRARQPAAPAAPRPRAKASAAPRPAAKSSVAKKAAASTVAVKPTVRATAHEKVGDVLKVLPELEALKPLPLNQAVARLREHGLLSKNGSSVRFFAALAPHFVLSPPEKPSQVRWQSGPTP